MPVNVNFTAPQPPASRPTDTGKVFWIGILEKGSILERIVIHSMEDFKRLCGSRIAQSILWDCAEAFFEEGGQTIVLGRLLGKTPVAASVELETAAKAKSIKVAAKNPGEWGNGLTVQVKAGSGETFILIIREGETVLEESPELASQAAAATWSESSPYVTVTVLGGSGIPAVVAATALKNGTMDLEHLETAGYEAAKALLPKELGCGQIQAPGVTSSAVQKLLEGAAEETNRTGLIDLPKKGTETVAEYVTALLGAVASLRTATGARRSAAWAQWAVIPGLAPGTTRLVPYSVIQAGMLARNDATASPPPVNEPAAGENGQPRYATGLQVEFTRAQREQLEAVGINCAWFTPEGVLETEGNRTLVKPEAEPAWEKLSAARLFMYAYSKGEQIMRRSEKKDVDPKGLLVGKIRGELTAFVESIAQQIQNNPVEAVSVGLNGKGEPLANMTLQPDQVAGTLTLNIATEVA